MGLVGLLATAASALAVLHGGATASAAPCGNGGFGSSGFGSSLPGTGSLGTGSLGTGSDGSSGSSLPNIGPQGPLPLYVGASTRTIAWVTGPLSINRTFSRFAISGTDLGISWDNGSGQTLMAFGDTFGNCNAIGQQWRHNVLLRTDDDRLADGITVPNGVADDITSGTVIAPGAPNVAQELIPALGLDYVEVTKIPTSAISLPRPGGGHRQFMNFMSVRSWGDAGRWVTNYSAIAYSDNNGQTWQVDQSTMLINAPVSLALPGDLAPVEYNNGKFQQVAYVRGQSASVEERDYVYQFGTPNGRFGAGFLARFRPDDILSLDRYQYWAGTTRGWVDDITAIPDDGSAIVVPAPVTELSVAWSPYLGKYLMLDGDNGIRMRTADHPEGPWSAPKTLVRPGAVVLYGPMMLANSPALNGNSKDLYFNASRWSDYNVMLLRADLSKVR
ncbi:DUF4185 domain-containing protein [Gordonia sp. ABSL1-1]|uniref:DUF4185 domain-containing protein n=1 Tax=Gordonia sp. ABSL1-1 TaxID=3053923 RepID=UPI002572A61A|nr:DUF4185 domain-containing protein [Gordonia sp. ABSL1-1]MDL9937233.1 DUF4185 domain-containing protein [Gordonia sp. ABSL1-1]